MYLQGDKGLQPNIRQMWKSTSESSISDGDV